jgi:type 1 fimbria pilin
MTAQPTSSHSRCGASARRVRILPVSMRIVSVSTGGRLALIRRLVAVLLAIAPGLVCGTAQATCSFTSGHTFTNVTLTLPALLTAARNTAVGTILYDSGWTGNTGTSITCGGGEPVTVGYASAMTPVSGMNHVYATGVPGIGIKAAYSNALSAAYWPANIDNVGNYAAWLLDWHRYSTLSAGSMVYTPAGVYRVQYIVTGPLQSGSFTMTIPNPTGTTSYGSLLTNQVSFTTTTVNIQSLGCQVMNSNIVVQLPTAMVLDMKGVGGTTGATAFQIPLVCDSGVQVAYELDGTAGSNAPGVLANQTGNGYATGVGVQVLQGKTPVTLNALSGTYITTTSSSQSVNIPFTAQYYQTAATPTAGAVQATATFQMTYQ